MNKKNIDDESYALIIDDRDTDFLVLDAGDDILLCSGDVTDDWELYYIGNTNRAPAVDLGEHEYGWYLLDLDDDHIAEGSDPLNWDTDGDWLVDWFEVKDDEEDGMRGDSSPIRYDSQKHVIMKVRIPPKGGFLVVTVRRLIQGLWITPPNG